MMLRRNGLGLLVGAVLMASSGIEVQVGKQIMRTHNGLLVVFRAPTA